MKCRAPFLPLICVSESCFWTQCPETPFSSHPGSCWIGATPHDFAGRYAAEARYLEPHATSLLRVSSRNIPVVFRGVVRGSFTVRLSNELRRSLSYTLSRLQRLIESSCKSNSETGSILQAFHELFRFPLAFATSGLRSSEAATESSLHDWAWASISTLRGASVRPRRTKQSGFAPASHHTFHFMLRSCFRPETRMGFHTDHRAQSNSLSASFLRTWQLDIAPWSAVQRVSVAMT